MHGQGQGGQISQTVREEWQSLRLLLFITLASQTCKFLLSRHACGSKAEVVSGLRKIRVVLSRNVDQNWLSLLQGLGGACLLHNTATSSHPGRSSSRWSVLHVAFGWDRNMPRPFHLIVFWMLCCRAVVRGIEAVSPGHGVYCTDTPMATTTKP